MLATRSLTLSLVAGACLVLAPAAAADPVEKLPDLVQHVPEDLGVVDAGGTWHFGFTSAVENYGAGELHLESHRVDTSDPNMTSDQVVQLEGGGSTTYPAVSTSFFYAPHNHWHYLNLDRYSLRRDSDGAPAATDHKQGFCLGDRYRRDSNGNKIKPLPPGEEPPYHYDDCQEANPNALSVVMGMSPGYGDDYYAQLEGQFIDLTGVPAGRYDVVHVANSDCTLHESSLLNNAAAVKVDLSYAPDGTPDVAPVPGVVDATKYAPCGAAPPQTPTDGGSQPSSSPGPTTQTTLSPTPTPTFASARILGGRVTVSKKGWMRFRVRCLRSRCRGNLSVTRTAMRSGTVSRKVLAHHRFSVAAGQTATVRVRLSRSARRLLTRLGRLPVTAAVRLDARADGSRPAPVARGVVLRAPGAKTARVATTGPGSQFLCWIAG
jgi:Lysyl oxidase